VDELRAKLDEMIANKRGLKRAAVQQLLIGNRMPAGAG
jgi:hypothetical protein